MKRFFDLQQMLFATSLCLLGLFAILLTGCGQTQDVGCVAVTCIVDQHQSSSTTEGTHSMPKHQISSGGTSNTSLLTWNTSHYSGGHPLTLTGPAIVECDCSVNNDFQGDGQTKVGTLIILRDASQYLVSGPNPGTIYAATGGTPTDTDFQNEATSIIDVMHKAECAGGCETVKVVTFESGKRMSQPAYK